MNTDITWCSGLRCDRTQTCSRWIKHLEQHLKKSGRSIDGIYISAAQFADHDGKCTHYIPIEKKRQKR